MGRVREWTARLLGTLRRVRRDADLQEELRMHLELAADDARRRGAAPQDQTRALRLRAGSIAHAMDALRDQRGLPWLDAIGSDVVFGWRQLIKHRVSSAVAVLSLGLAIGATTAAFRLVDAVLLRPLPIERPERFFAVAISTLDAENRPDYDDVLLDYPTFREYSRLLAGHADSLLVGLTARQPLAIDAGGEPEIAFRQFVSGNVFGRFGLQPALGRLFTPNDDVSPGAHPVAVLSHDYWTRRFGRDPGAIGRTLRIANQPYEIVGVAPRGFTGTEPGSVPDVFLPAMMNAQAINSSGWSWFRMWVRPNDGVPPDQIRQMLQARLLADRREQIKGFPKDTPKEQIDAALRAGIRLLPAAAGVSGTQKTFRRPLAILGVLAVLVLLIACANVANLLTARSAARSREMALRVSIGAGRSRLVRLMLVESALLAFIASVVGVLFALWSAPFVVSMLALPERPLRLVLDVDWRLIGFGFALAMAVTVLFGIVPALRASAVEPLSALKGGQDPPAPRRLANALVAVQVAFCVFLLFAAGLFVTTLGRLVNQPLGFAPENLFLVLTESRASHPAGIWSQVADHLRRTPGVVDAAVAGWAPLTSSRWRLSVQVPGRPAPPDSPHFLSVSPGFFATMRIGMIDGRDFRLDDAPPRLGEQKEPIAGVGIVNEAFARAYFDGQSPIGRQVHVRQTGDVRAPMEIVGVVRDAVYFSVRERMSPAVYVPFDRKNNATLLVRVSEEGPALAAALRREVSRARPDMRVRAVEPQTAFVRQQMIRERLLATLSSFFAIVALLLAAIGLYGVLNYAVIRRRREIGIHMALGARPAHIVGRVTGVMFAIVCVGAAIGLAGGVAFGRAVQAMLFRVGTTDPAALAPPLVTLFAAAALAALVPVTRAVRTDPARTLRTE